MKKISIIVLWLIIVVWPYFVFSAGMDSTYKYAWSDTLGWINFNPTNGNVQVFDDKLSGYIWSENYSWINLSPTNGGVRNDGNGNLSGYAWGENIGWIDFSNVKIDPNTGKFSGYAIILGGPGGKISFDCNNCKVITEWRKSISPPPLIYRSSLSVYNFYATYTPPQETPLALIFDTLNNLVRKLEIPKEIPGEVFTQEEIVKPLPKIIPPSEFRKHKEVEIISELQPPLYLPEPLKTFAERIEKFREQLIKIGLTSRTALNRFVGIVLNLPSLTEILEIPRNLTFSQIKRLYKELIPSDVLIVRTKNNVFDIPIKINIEKDEKIILNFKTIKGEDLDLIYKPSKPVNNIKGYLIFRERKSLGFLDLLTKQISNILVSLNLVNKVGNLVIEEFDYKDEDKDGIYLAKVSIPNITGVFEIKTIVKYYEDIPPREVSLTVYVNPAGYVYEKILGKEARIEGAKVYLYWLNPEVNKIELWPSDQYYQQNPQTTNKSGEYSFLIPPGKYIIKVEAEGYYPYQSAIFEIKENDYINLPIELKNKKFLIFNLIDWKIFFIILLALTLIIILKLKKYKWGE